MAAMSFPRTKQENRKETVEDFEMTKTHLQKVKQMTRHEEYPGGEWLTVFKWDGIMTNVSKESRRLVV
jgi:hypothetical protein